ncbi:hypothetical protein [Bacillus solitudinis]|uniref:hypothetical protein n=1 Tax=Bacillus solitudinis TaxID=2014074 RepID=UPI000C24F3C2|nr:hypothetical protein [Bacillus solitudinis]
MEKNSNSYSRISFLLFSIVMYFSTFHPKTSTLSKVGSRCFTSASTARGKVILSIDLIVQKTEKLKLYKKLASKVEESSNNTSIGGPPQVQNKLSLIVILS